MPGCGRSFDGLLPTSEHDSVSDQALEILVGLKRLVLGQSYLPSMYLVCGVLALQVQYPVGLLSPTSSLTIAQMKSRKSETSLRLLGYQL